MYFDENMLLKAMVCDAIENNSLYLCVSSKDDGYEFFNISDTDYIIEFVAYIVRLQINADDFDIFLVSDIEKREMKKQFEESQLYNDVSTLDKILQAKGYEIQ